MNPYELLYGFYTLFGVVMYITGTIGLSFYVHWITKWEES